MSLSIVHSRALVGLNAAAVHVEIHISAGLPSFQIVGLPDTEVREARDRVRAALTSVQFKIPPARIIVNLAPADLPKNSGRFDLPIAIGIMAATGQIPVSALKKHEFIGELSLTGLIRPVRGALPMALAVQQTGRIFIVPHENANEAALITEGHVIAASSLKQVCEHLNNTHIINQYTYDPTLQAPQKHLLDLSEVKGQIMAKRALEIAAAGGHNLLMKGPPGTGKSMLAARLPYLLPPLTHQEHIEIAKIQSLVSGFVDPQCWGKRPFRQPHHTASAVALIGGGKHARPGEISLAHHGVLFLDELPEFQRQTLEALREPLETGEIHISRAATHVTYPARFQLLAAMNPCPCGYLGHPNQPCQCSAQTIARYHSRLSGPFLDRIDLFVEVSTMAPEELLTLPIGENTETIKTRVHAAHHMAIQRQGVTNALLSGKQLEQYAQLTHDGHTLLISAAHRFNLSARTIHRVLRVARSIADLAEQTAVLPQHIADALRWRPTTPTQRHE